MKEEEQEKEKKQGQEKLGPKEVLKKRFVGSGQFFSCSKGHIWQARSAPIAHLPSHFKQPRGENGQPANHVWLPGVLLVLL